MARNRFAAAIIGLGLLALSACTKSTDLISVEEGDPACTEPATKSATVIYKITLRSGGPISYSFAATSKVEGEGVVAKGGKTIPNMTTTANESITVDRPVTVKFTDQAGESVTFEIDSKSICSTKK